jgi:hypothetical protein
MAAAMRISAIALAMALVSAIPASAQAPQGPIPNAASFQSDVVAQQLGTKLAPGHHVDFVLGKSVTGELTDPARLARYGVPGAHQGARVTAMRLAADRIVVEVDEVDPAPRTRRTMLKVDERGNITPIKNDSRLAKGEE